MKHQERFFPSRREDKGREAVSNYEPIVPKVGEAAVISAIDDLMDEIDEILEDNAEQFVSQYVQKGGE